MYIGFNKPIKQCLNTSEKRPMLNLWVTMKFSGFLLEEIGGQPPKRKYIFAKSQKMKRVLVYFAESILKTLSQQPPCERKKYVFEILHRHKIDSQ